MPARMSRDFSVLIVEDEPMVAYFLRRVLEKMGATVVGTVDNGEEAIRVAEKSLPTLALMDIGIQGNYTGTQTASILHENFATPIIYITAYADDATLGEAVKAYPFGYLVKPVDEGDVRSAVVAALARISPDKAPSRIPLAPGILWQKDQARILHNGGHISLTKKEGLLLDILVQHHTKLVSFERIESYVWDGLPPSDTARRTLIWRLRTKIPDLPIDVLPAQGCRLGG